MFKKSVLLLQRLFYNAAIVHLKGNTTFKLWLKIKNKKVEIGTSISEVNALFIYFWNQFLVQLGLFFG